MNPLLAFPSGVPDDVYATWAPDTTISSCGASESEVEDALDNDYETASTSSSRSEYSCLYRDLNE